MRYNRIWMVLTILAAAFALGGCMNVPDLTEKEADIVAEYSAGILLRYSDRYENRLITKDSREEVPASEAVVTPAPTPAAAVTDEPAAAPAGDKAGSADGADTMGDGPGSAGALDGNTGGTDAAAGRPAEDDSFSQVSLNELFHIKGLELSYKSYQFCDRYPKGNNDTFSITAGESETLLILHFQARNKSGAKKKFSLGKRAKNISYTLNVDGSEYQPGINILKNSGLNYLNTTIKKNGKEDAVLIFTMAKERQQASSISLQIKEGNKAVNLQLK